MQAQHLTSSMEDYLEAILHLVRLKQVARVRDIAQQLKVAMPSVTAALKSLAAKGLVNYDPYQFITLTAQGQDLAQQVAQKHQDITRFLVEVLGLDDAVAGANACRMEHAVDEAVLQRLRLLGQFLLQCPRTGKAWVSRFTDSMWTIVRRPISQSRCRQCMLEAIRQFREER